MAMPLLICQRAFFLFKGILFGETRTRFYFFTPTPAVDVCGIPAQLIVILTLLVHLMMRFSVFSGVPTHFCEAFQVTRNCLLTGPRENTLHVVLFNLSCEIVSLRALISKRASKFNTTHIKENKMERGEIKYISTHL